MSTEREAILNQIISQLQNEYRVDEEITTDTNIVELVDSLDIMNYIFFLEEKFNIQISDEQVENESILVISNTIDLILSTKK